MDVHNINIKGVNITYRYSGNGPALVLLHGIPTHSGLWDDVSQYMGKHFSIYAFDLLGFGESDRRDSRDMDIKSQASLLRDAFRELGLSNIIVAGHDMGGGIAMYLSLTDPDIMKAMVLINSVCYDSWPIELLKVRDKVEMLFKHLPPDILHSIFVKYMEDGFYNKERAHNAVEKYWKYILDGDSIKDFLKTVDSFNSKYTMEIAPFLKNIRIPTLILWGRHDKYLKPSYGYRLNEDIRNSNLEVIENGGHFLPEDQPEKVSEAIIRFAKKI